MNEDEIRDYSPRSVIEINKPVSRKCVLSFQKCAVNRVKIPYQFSNGCRYYTVDATVRTQEQISSAKKRKRKTPDSMVEQKSS